jgi:hypothetical protein
MKNVQYMHFATIHLIVVNLCLYCGNELLVLVLLRTVANPPTPSIHTASSTMRARDVAVISYATRTLSINEVLSLLDSANA